MKRKTTKRVLAGVLSASMMLGLTACGGNGNTNTTTPAPTTTASSGQSNATDTTDATTTAQTELAPLKLSVMLPSNTQHAKGDLPELDRMLQDISDYTNTDVEWIFYAEDMYNERLTLLYTSGDLPSVLVTAKNAEFVNACENDFFWDITDYVDDYSNLATIPEVVRLNAGINGKLYGVPRSRTMARNGIGYRLDWLNNLGLKEPTTLQEYYDMLYAFTYNDPDGNGQNDTYGFVLRTYTGPWDIMQLWFGAPNGWGIDDNGDLIPAHITEEYDNALKWFRQIYSEGLVNPDFRDLPTEDWDVLLRTGVGGGSADVIDRFRRNQTYFEREGISAETQLAGAIDAGFGMRCMPTSGFSNMLSISKTKVKTEDELKRVLKFLNDLNDAAMLDTIEIGYEGVTYKINDDGYFERYTEEEKLALGVTTAAYNKGYAQVLAGFSTEEEKAKRVPGVPYEGLQAYENQLYEENIPYCIPNYGASYTSATYVASGTELDAIINEGRLDYITGVIDDVGLQSVKEQWLKSGGQKVIDEMNELYHAAGN